MFWFIVSLLGMLTVGIMIGRSQARDEIKRNKDLNDEIINQVIEIDELHDEIEQAKAQAERMRNVAVMISKYANPLELDKTHFAEYLQLCEEVEAAGGATDA